MGLAFQGLTGSAEFTEAAIEPDVAAPILETPHETYAGSGFLSKLILFGIIVGVVVAYFKTRKNPAMTEKSLA